MSTYSKDDKLRVYAQ